MRATVFLWAGLLLIGSVSISKCYPNNNEDDDERPSNVYNVRSEASDESDESSKSARSQTLDELLDAYESKRNMNFAKRSCSGCSPACRKDQLCVAPNLCVCPGGRVESPCPIQSAHLCHAADKANVKPIVSITFGEGSAHYSRATPASLGFRTNYGQVHDDKTNDGYFSIVNETPGDFGSWIAGGLDHTQQCHSGKNKGYMMLVNAKIAAGEVLSIDAKDLCVGLRYEFSVYVANVVKRGTNIIKPNLKFEVRTATSDHTLLATESSGDIAEQDKLTWIHYGMSFITPASSVVISFHSNAPGGSGDDFVIDDVTLVSCSPGHHGVCK